MSPENLGVELGEFTIPTAVLPIPAIPELPLSGSIKVNLTGLESASLAVHVSLPGVLSDGNGHGLTEDTTLELSNAHGLELNFLRIKVPSLSQIGLSRLKKLEFTYSRPTSLFEGKGTLDLNDAINGEVDVAMTFEHGAFQHAHVDYTAPAGGGYPLFGPVFLTYVGADLSLNPTKFFSGQANLAIGPAVIAKCGAVGVDGTLTLVFDNPFTSTRKATCRCCVRTSATARGFTPTATGTSASAWDSTSRIPGLGGVSGELYGQAYGNFNENIFEAQIDGSWALQTAPGSPPLHSVQVARQLPEPKIKARVSGRGAKRVLSYSLTPQPGLAVSFVEGVDAGASPIGQARGSHGRIGFTPSLGSTKGRTIIAEIIRNGRLAASTVVARYAPGTIRPGRPSHILARHARRLGGLLQPRRQHDRAPRHRSLRRRGTDPPRRGRRATLRHVGANDRLNAADGDPGRGPAWGNARTGGHRHVEARASSQAPLSPSGAFARVGPCRPP